MPDTLYGPPRATVDVLLDDPDEHDFASAERLLGGISAEQAVAVLPGLPYSIASILAHMNANVGFNLALIRSPNPATFKNSYENWPVVTSEMWPELVAEFLAGIAELKSMAQEEELNRVLFPNTGTEPAWTVGYKLAVSVAKHNAYHFGQIALLRRLLGIGQ